MRIELLWAPWRSAYIRGEAGREGCFICEAVRRGPSPETLALYVGELSVVLLNRYPYNPGHLMVAPVRHVPSLEDLRGEELTDLIRTVRNTISLLREALDPHGFNVGINLGGVAGAGLRDHVHVHVVPRWEGDTNFMPVVAGTKVVSESLERTYEHLRKYVGVLERGL